METKQLEVIKETVTELMKKAGFESEIDIVSRVSEDKENLICNVQVKEDSHLLIGQYGVNLQALQHIARLLVRKKTDQRTKFILDVNSYRQQKNESIIDLAKQAAEEAVCEGRAVVMRPMSAYERRLVHTELAGNVEVETESVGEGESRKVIVKPAKKI